MIQFFHVYKTYARDVEALVDINLQIQKGEFVFIAGPSGAGKTTLLRLLFRDELPTSGQILVNGRNVVKLRDRAIPHLRRSIGVVFQDFKLLRDRSIFDNLALVYRVLGMPSAAGKRKVANLLKLVGLSHKSQMMPYRLSGGEQQRVAIARALANDPPILLADEPTGNLDSETGKRIIDLLGELNAAGKTIVLVTHEEALAHAARRIVRVRDGRLTEDV